MWQALRTELHPLGVEIVTVAMDVAGASVAQPFVDAAKPDHPSLLDQEHVIGRLLGVVNVPNSVWIDEDGRIVRPVEPAHPDRGVPAPAKRWQAPEDAPQLMKDMLAEANRIVVDPAGYTARLRDWAARGSESPYVMSETDVIAASGARTIEHSEAAARFELGQHLWSGGNQAAAIPHWRLAHRLQPDNWTYKRQAWVLADPMQGPSTDYDSYWLADIRKVGPEHYYPPLAV